MSSPYNIGTQDTLSRRDSHSPIGWPVTLTKSSAVSRFEIGDIPAAYFAHFSEVPVSKLSQNARKADISAYNLNHPDFSSCLDGASPNSRTSPTSSPNSPQTPRTPRSPSPSNPIDTPDSEQPVAKKVARPPNAFLLFRSDWLKKGEIPFHVEKRQQHLSRVVGEIWGLLDESERQLWHQKAHDIKILHEKAHPGYKFIPSPRGSRRNKDKAQAMGEDGETAADKARNLRETYTRYHGPSPIPSRRKQAKKARRGSGPSAVNPTHWSAPNSPQSRSMPIHPSSMSSSGPSQIQNPIFFQQPQFTQAPRPSSSLGFYSNPQHYSLPDVNATASQSSEGFNYNFASNSQNMMYGNLGAADLASRMNGLGIFGGSSPHIETRTQADIHQQLGGAFPFPITVTSPQGNTNEAQSFGLLADQENPFLDFDMFAFMNPSQDYLASSTMGLDFQTVNQFDYNFNN